MTADELRVFGLAHELAELAGLDGNRDPGTYSAFIARAEEVIRAAERKGEEDALIEQEWSR